MSITNLEQYRAVKISVSLGWDLQRECPWIAESYRHGKTKTEILKEIIEETNLLKPIFSESIQLNAIGRALRGYNGKNGIPSYSGLISLEEMQIIARKNQINGLENGREKSKENKTGRYSSDTQSGLAKKSAIARGQIPWTDEEKDLARELKIGGITYSPIADVLNYEFHCWKDERNRRTVYEMFRRNKK